MLYFIVSELLTSIKFKIFILPSGSKKSSKDVHRQVHMSFCILFISLNEVYIEI